ncbi:hypothetical protein LCGC14_2328750 [marine sediment metagenome]|uniref:Uncharacterized protein n=1 Tax=marine sediment metagenome TaxID=412755 RepID=A0A0F9CG70_9ZZZZ
MSGEIKYWIVKGEDGLWSVKYPRSGYIARDKSLPTCLRRAATKLTKLGVK